MKRLISGQSLRIDNHHRGQQVIGTRGLHIHKVMNNDNYNGAEVLIPLYPNSEIEFRKIKGSNSIQDRIKNEIKSAFKDRKTRDEFVKYTLNKIESYSQNLSYQERINSLIEGAISLASHFDLIASFRQISIKVIQDKIISYTSQHKDENGNTIYIIQDVDGRNIRIGDDLSLLDDWDRVIEMFNS